MVPLPKMIRIVLKVYYLSLLILNNYLALKVVGKEIETNNGATRNYFMANEDTEYVSDEYADIKQQIGLEKKEADIFFQKVTKQLKKQLEKIKEKGDEIIPETTFQKIINNNGYLSESIIRRVRKHGILVVRNTIPPKETLNMMSDLLDYMDKNDIYPTSNFTQTAQDIFWSKPQMQARQHPNMVKIQKVLLRDLWHKQQDNEVDVDLRFSKYNAEFRK